MNETDLINSWYAEIYDQHETQTDDVDFLLSILGNKPKTILEVCCGSGRILVPLARAGHKATGFDMDEFMLERIPAKAEGIENLAFYKEDAVAADWGRDFDIVILAGNILINIVTPLDYKEAQQLFIKKAANSLKTGGYIYLDFNLFSNPEVIFGNNIERVIFEGTDCNGTYGKYSILEGTYDIDSQIYKGRNRTELITGSGEKIILEKEATKYIPTLHDVYEWLENAGFVVEAEYGDYNGNPIDNNTCRTVIYARKVK